MLTDISPIPTGGLLRNSKSPTGVEHKCVVAYTRNKDTSVVSEILKMSIGETHDAWLHTQWVSPDDNTGSGSFFLSDVQINNIIDNLVEITIESETYAVCLENILVFHPAIVSYLLVI